MTSIAVAAVAAEDEAACAEASPGSRQPHPVSNAAHRALVGFRRNLFLARELLPDELFITSISFDPFPGPWASGADKGTSGVFTPPRALYRPVKAIS